jgi:hypothetical protein
MRTKIHIFSILAILLISGCQSVTQQEMQNFTWQKPNQENGRIYVYRTSAFTGGGINFPVNLTGASTQGVCKAGGYFYFDLKPGKHILWAKSDITSSSKCLVEVMPGETYYVEGSVGIGLLVGRAQISLADPTRARSIIPTLKYNPYTPKAK